MGLSWHRLHNLLSASRRWAIGSSSTGPGRQVTETAEEAGHITTLSDLYLSRLPMRSFQCSYTVLQGLCIASRAAGTYVPNQSDSAVPPQLSRSSSATALFVGL